MSDGAFGSMVLASIERELRVARGLASCLGDEAALDEADAELRALRARLTEATRLLGLAHTPCQEYAEGCWDCEVGKWLEGGADA